MTRDEMIEKLEAVEQFCTYQCNDAAARLDKRANAEAVQACVAVNALRAALSRPAPPDDLVAKLDAALNDALYKDTQAGHSLPWREVTALCDALKRRLSPLAAPAPAPTEPRPWRLVMRTLRTGGSAMTCDVKLLAPSDERGIATFFCPRRGVAFSRQVLPGGREMPVKCDRCPIPDPEAQP